MVRISLLLELTNISCFLVWQEWPPWRPQQLSLRSFPTRVASGSFRWTWLASNFQTSRDLWCLMWLLPSDTTFTPVQFCHGFMRLAQCSSIISTRNVEMQITRPKQVKKYEPKSTKRYHALYCSSFCKVAQEKVSKLKLIPILLCW